MGCGLGNYSFYFSRQKNVYVQGIDINESAISICELIKNQLSRPNVKFFIGNSHLALERFESNYFDVSLAIEVLQYLPDVRLAVLGIGRIIKPGGYLIGHVPALGYLRPEENTLFDDEKLRALLIAAGYEVVYFTPTFGGAARRLCTIYDRIVRWKLLTALVYPFLIIFSWAFRVEAKHGDYLFFVARKPKTS